MRGEVFLVEPFVGRQGRIADALVFGERSQMFGASVGDDDIIHSFEF
jgi:hypothetical protein